MRKFLVALAIMGATSVPAFAQTTPTTTTPATTNQVQPAKPQMIKKRVCEQVDEDSYSRLGNRKICKTVEVPAEQPNNNTQSPTNNSSEHGK